ncbi:MAG TPA: hypothetical protein VFP84_39145 [Kofleriaceae bacterium]|nr:hypothetical protein [Kofleriaceae bacterium]
MQNPNNPATEPATRTESRSEADAAEPTVAARPWQAEVGQLLQRAAALCTEHGVEVDAYMSGAWTAYIEARPGMREQLEEAQLREQLGELRRLGRMAEA